MEDIYKEKYYREKGIKDGTKDGIIVGLFFLCIFIIGLSGMMYSTYRAMNNNESQSMNSSESISSVKSYNDDMIELISRKTIYDDDHSPVVYIVKDKETSKEYIIFTSNKADSMQVFPR